MSNLNAKGHFASLVRGRKVFALGSAPSASLQGHEHDHLLIASNGSISPFSGLIPDVLFVNNYTTKQRDLVAQASIMAMKGRQTRHLVCTSGVLSFDEMLEVLCFAGLTWETAEEITIEERRAIIETALGRPIAGPYGENVTSTGVTAILWAHQCGAKNIVMSGYSANGGHSYISGATPRKHAALDHEALARIKLQLGDRKSRTKVKFVGNHSRYHCGSQAVVEVIMAEICAAAALTDNDDYDVMVINGEGSMHHRKPNYLAKIEAARQAVATCRPYHLINTVWQDNGQEDAALIRQAYSVFVREVRSQRNLFADTGVVAEIIPDLSYVAPVDPAAEHRDLSGRIAVTDFYSPDFATFIRVQEGPLSHHVYLPMRKTSWSSFVNTLKTADLLVTGRHHAVFAACRARTPFVALAGNTHKIEGIVESAGLNIPICRDPQEISNAIKWAQANRAIYEQLFDWLDEQPRWHFNPGHE